MSNTGDTPKQIQKSDIDLNLLSAVYQSLSARRLGYDTLMWQVPALSFTAQAFLMTIALGKDSHPAACLTAATLSLVVALMSMQLMSKQRFLEVVDSILMEKNEDKIDLETFIGFKPHSRIEIRSNQTKVKLNRFIHYSSYRIWQTGLALFALTALGIIVITIIALTQSRLLP